MRLTAERGTESSDAVVGKVRRGNKWLAITTEFFFFFLIFGGKIDAVLFSLSHKLNNVIYNITVAAGQQGHLV